MTTVPNSVAPVLFVVRERASHWLVVSAGFHTVSALNRTTEMMYAIHSGLRRQGVASRVCSVAVQWPFRAKAWVKVYAATLQRHRVPRRVLAKRGFHMEGKRRNFCGEPIDYLLFSIVPGVDAASPRIADYAEKLQQGHPP